MKHILCLLLALLFPTVSASAQMGPPETITAKAFDVTPAGQNVVLAVRVASRSRTTLNAEILDHTSGQRYHPTGKRVTLYIPEETPFVMGSASDVTAGAVLAVYAVTTTAGHADVKKVVVLTP